MGKGQTSMGRKKIEIKRIECAAARHVCFTKRRQGLFKKASELSILCGTMVGVIVFSPAGRAFSLGSPSIKVVIDEHYLSLGNHSSPTVDHGIHNVSTVENTVMLQQYKDLEESIEAKKIQMMKLEEEIEQKGCGSLMHYTTTNISGLGADELQEICNKLEAIKDIVKERINQVWHEKQAARVVVDDSFVSGVQEVSGFMDYCKDPFDG